MRICLVCVCVLGGGGVRAYVCVCVRACTSAWMHLPHCARHVIVPDSTIKMVCNTKHTTATVMKLNIVFAS